MVCHKLFAVAFCFCISLGNAMFVDNKPENTIAPPTASKDLPPEQTLTVKIPDGAKDSTAPKPAMMSAQPWPEEPSALMATSGASTIFPFAKGFPAKSFLVCVVTSPDHFKARVAIRNVWKQYQMSKIVSKSDWEGMTLRFFIGNLAPTVNNRQALEQKLYEEANMYLDVVRLDSFNEAYLNLTSKTLGIIEWAKENKYESIFKMDDDSFLRLDNLVQFLKAEMRPQFIYAGSFITDNTVSDNPNSKWYNRDLYDHNTYPDYAGGPGYYLGSKVLDYLYDNRKSFVKYRVEDAAVGIWSQNMINIDRVNLASMIYSHECFDSQEIVYLNPVNAEEMEALIQNVLMGDMCSNFQLTECRTFPCLCHPIPEDCEYINAKTWSDFSNEQYIDQIPRLLQTSSKATNVRRPAFLEKKVM